MLSIKNWDNKTWISSTKYIQYFNIFLLKQKKLTKHSKILDIGCGRGKIMGSLSSKLKLINKPIGIDIENHKDTDKRITFKKTNAIKYLRDNKIFFDLILIKQTIHFFNLRDIKKILSYSNASLKMGGIILILSLDTKNNEIPTFNLMKQKLNQSFKREILIWEKLLQLNIKKSISKFNFKVNIKKKVYLKMIRQRYISTLLKFSSLQISNGINEINLKYKKNILFNDKLKLINQPIGLDIENHKDFDKRITFKKTNAIKYLTNNKKKFDLILIKQTIHFFNLRDIKKILRFSYDSLEVGGVILILTLDTKNNEIPTFSLMKKKLKQSFKRDILIWKKLLQLSIKKNITKFNFKVNVEKNIYLKMIKQRYISTLLKFSSLQISNGINEINLKYKKNILFNDKLKCIVFTKV